MAGLYDLKLVVLSVVVAAFASYTALELAGRVSANGYRFFVPEMCTVARPAGQ